jgi:hypothetical protein
MFTCSSEESGQINKERRSQIIIIWMLEFRSGIIIIWMLEFRSGTELG